MERSNIHIMGEGSSSGGQFGKVKIMGEADFFGSVECEQFKVTGEAIVDGSLAAEEIKVTGTLRLKKAGAAGDSAARQENSEGSAGSQFGYEAESGFGVQADRRVESGLRAESVKITGELSVPGSCEAEEFKLRGQIEAGGVLSAEDIDIKLHGVSRVHEMGGARISVKAKTNIPLGGLFQMGQGSLIAHLIEGDYIYLENTEADSVRGVHVEIGPGCRIGTVEYRDSLEIDSRAEVLSQSRV